LFIVPAAMKRRRGLSRTLSPGGGWLRVVLDFMVTRGTRFFERVPSGTQFSYDVYLLRTPPINRGVAGQSASTPSGDSSDINHLEPAAEYIDWFNHRRLHGEIGHVPPVEYEQLHAGHPAPVLLSISN
jgi:transposase InsO family protein